MEIAQQALGHQPLRLINISMIVDSVRRRFGVRSNDLMGKGRARAISLPRQVCMYLARELTQQSLEEIGNSIGGRDHTTVIHAVRAVRRQMDESEPFRAMIEELRQELLGGGARSGEN